MKRLLFFIALFSGLQSRAQIPETRKNKKEVADIRSIDTFFAGIPINGSYGDWIEYIAANPDLGIDSTGERGVYSSYKAGRKDHFPFPDTLKVKMLAYKEISSDSLSGQPTDSIESISVEGIFGDGKEARKAAKSYFEKLRGMLKEYYKTDRNDFNPYEDGRHFAKGINSNFPDILLFRGYFSPLGFYYVVLVYERR